MTVPTESTAGVVIIGAGPSGYSLLEQYTFLLWLRTNHFWT